MKKIIKQLKEFNWSPVLCVILAFAGAVFITPFSGFATALPLLPLCALAAGYLNFNPAAKVIIFALCGALLRAGYSSDRFDIIVFAAVCGVSVLLGHFTAKLFRAKKYRFWAVIPLGIIFALQLAFGGNIVAYINAKNISDNYVNQTYDGCDETVGKLEYHYITRTWRREIQSLPTPVVKGELVVYKDYIQDNYVNKVERHLMSERRTEIANVLRAAFPNGSFTVESENIYGYPYSDISANDQSDDTEKMVFAVYLGALTDEEGFLNTAYLYRKAIEDAGIDYGNIIFRGGGHGMYPMEEVYTESLFDETRIKYNCGTVFAYMQKNLDKYFLNK